MASTEPIREAIRQAGDWIAALGADGELRDGADICEITGLRTLPPPPAQTETVRLWDSVTGKPEHVLEGNTGWVRGVYSVQTGEWTLVASASDRPRVRRRRLSATSWPGSTTASSPT